MERDFKYPPLIFNVYKPAGISSYDVVRHFKRKLPPGYGKIGHFGTLDPFAEGVLLIGVAGATRINDYVHQYLPKTYVAVGKLGVFTETGDMTVPISQTDDSAYLTQTISRFSLQFINEQIKQKFLGSYLQSPHKYSAAKFEGKPLHQWAREGVEVVKEEVERQIYELAATDYSFPYLTIESTVSSGTYVRTLFKDCAEYLGTLGTLERLIRTAIGHLKSDEALQENQWPDGTLNWDPLQFGHTMDQVLPFPHLTLSELETKRYGNGIALSIDSPQPEWVAQLYWVRSDKLRLLGLGKWLNGELKPIFNLPQ